MAFGVGGSRFHVVVVTLHGAQQPLASTKYGTRHGLPSSQCRVRAASGGCSGMLLRLVTGFRMRLPFKLKVVELNCLPSVVRFFSEISHSEPQVGPKTIPGETRMGRIISHHITSRGPSPTGVPFPDIWEVEPSLNSLRSCAIAQILEVAGQMLQLQHELLPHTP